MYGKNANVTSGILLIIHGKTLLCQTKVLYGRFSKKTFLSDIWQRVACSSAPYKYYVYIGDNFDLQKYLSKHLNNIHIFAPWTLLSGIFS